MLADHLLERRHHAILIEGAALEVGLVPGRHLEQIRPTARARCQAGLVLVAVLGIDDVDGLLTATHAFDEEGIDDRAFLGGAMTNAQA